MDTLIQLLWAVLPSLIVGIVMSFWNKRQKEVEKHNEEKLAERIDKETLQLDLTVASAQLSYAVAMAVKRGTPNGEMETAIEKYETAMEAFRTYERKQISRNFIN